MRKHFGWKTCHVTIKCNGNVVDVTKMGKTVLRVGLKPRSLAFQARILSLHHKGCLLSLLYPHRPVYAAPCLRDRWRHLHSSPWNCKYCNAYNRIHVFLFCFCCVMNLFTLLIMNKCVNLVFKAGQHWSNLIQISYIF